MLLHIYFLLNTYCWSLQSIATRAKRCIHRKEFANLFVMFPILKHLAAMKSEFERTMEGCDPAIRGQYSIILNTLHSTVSNPTSLLSILFYDNLIILFYLIRGLEYWKK